jgi:hypothetical protein
MSDGKDRCLSQRDNRASTDVVNRRRVRQAGSERLVIELENATAVGFFLVCLFAPAMFARSISSSATGRTIGPVAA